MTHTDLINEAVPLVRHIAGRLARKYAHLSPQWDDLIADGLYGAYLAARTYQPGKGASWSTWAYPYIERYAVIGVRFHAGETMRGTGGTEPLPERFDRPAATELPEDAVIRARVRAEVTELEPRRRELVLRTYWNAEGPTSAGRAIGVSKTWARKLLADAHAELADRMSDLQVA